MKNRFKDPSAVERLAGDASRRSFYRIRLKDGSTAVKMITPPEQREDYYKYINTQKFLNEREFPVPEVLGTDEESLAIYLEDLGDTDYFALHRQLSIDGQRKWYGRFIELIIELISYIDEFRKKFPGKPELLGAERLRWEIDFFFENFMPLISDRKIDSGSVSLLRGWLYEIVEDISKYPVVLCHRDFHSKNLMICDDKIGVVDFQDMRLGPFNYDLCSLLWDSYVDIAQELIREVEELFYAKLRKMKIELNWKNFLLYNRKTAIQRNFKAIGTFAYQHKIGRTGYLPFIKTTSNKIIKHISSFTDSKEICEIIPIIFDAHT